MSRKLNHAEIALHAAEGADKLMHAAQYLSSTYLNQPNALLVSPAHLNHPDVDTAEAVRTLTDGYFDMLTVVTYINGLSDRFCYGR